MSVVQRRVAGAGMVTGVVAALVSTPAGAGTITGTSKGLTWTASSNIIGQTSTATQAPPVPPGTRGNPIYNPQRPFDNGVVALILNEGAAGNFICSGSLLSDRIHILTAGHCVSSGHSTITTVSATATFYGGLNPDAVVGTLGAPPPGGVRINIAAESVNPLYTGEVIDDHDIAVLTLAAPAPTFATGYSLYNASDLTGVDFNVAGYGGRSDRGGSVGVDLGTGRLRQGDNRYDFRFGDPAFGGLFDGGPGTTGFFGTAETNYSYLSDFDDGLPGQDASCGLAMAVGISDPGPQFCNLGRGATEASTAGGDSGGPQFASGRIASVTSYGLSFGREFQPGDIDNALNDTFGEFNGFVSTKYNLAYIQSVAPSVAASVPEPATWAMMVGGFGFVGAMTRRRRTPVAA